MCEPDNAPILAKGAPAEPAPFVDGAPQSHPDFRPHLMQDWSPDFIPKLTRDAMLADYVDEVVPISGDEAARLTHELALKEGIFCGVSGGAPLAGAEWKGRRILRASIISGETTEGHIEALAESIIAAWRRVRPASVADRTGETLLVSA